MGTPCTNHGYPVELWWRHAMEMLSFLLSLCEGNPPVTSGFRSQRASNMSFLFVICECKYSFQIRKLFKIEKISHTNSSVGSLIVLIRKTSFENLVTYPRIIHVHGLMQDNINSIAQALELLQSCTKPLMYSLMIWYLCFDLKKNPWIYLCMSVYAFQILQEFTVVAGYLFLLLFDRWLSAKLQ